MGVNGIRVTAQSELLGTTASHEITFLVNQPGAAPVVSVEGGLQQVAKIADRFQLRTRLEAQSVCGEAEVSKVTKLITNDFESCDTRAHGTCSSAALTFSPLSCRPSTPGVYSAQLVPKHFGTPG